MLQIYQEHKEYLIWGLTNFWLVMMMLALVLALLNKLIFFRKLSLSECIYRWFALFPLGATLLYAFIMHAFFPDFTAIIVGWDRSPFQYEVAMADLGFGLLAIFSFKASMGFRLATVIGNVAWLWGVAIGHIYQMIVHHNFSVGNAGIWFWMDVTMPFILILCLIDLNRKRSLIPVATSVQISH